MLMIKAEFTAQTRPERAVLRVSGAGALGFLNNLLTADLSTSAPAYAALLTPQGKILHDVFVVPDGEIVWLDVAREQADGLLKRLAMYRLRAKLEFAIDDSKAIGASSRNDLPGLSYADPRLAVMGWRSIMTADVLGEGEGYEAARISLGLADSIADIRLGEMFVHEANLDQLHGVSFSKGCYVGQEVVSRTQHRATARNRILPVVFSGEAPHGNDILSGDQRIGIMLSSAAEYGLALIRLDRLAEASSPLLCNGTQIKVRRPAWASFALQIPEVAQ
jgi:tRNA-modifying protein YgfZ